MRLGNEDGGTGGKGNGERVKEKHYAIHAPFLFTFPRYPFPVTLSPLPLPLFPKTFYSPKAAYLNNLNL